MGCYAGWGKKARGGGGGGVWKEEWVFVGFEASLFFVLIQISALLSLLSYLLGKNPEMGLTVTVIILPGRFSASSA